MSPVAWDAPKSNGYSGVFASNAKLVDMSLIHLNGAIGPEDIVAKVEDSEISLFASSQSGVIYEIDPLRKEVSEFTQTGGFPLGVEFANDGTLLVADAYLGLLKVSPDGDVKVLTNSVSGDPIKFADDVDIAPSGIIYFTDASTRFGAEETGSPLAASQLDILEQSQTGRVLAFDPQSGDTSIVADGLSFANGIAVSRDGNSLLVAETGTYRVVKIDIATGTAPTPILTNLPGFPDNINAGPRLADGTPTYFLGLAGPRMAILDDLSDRPFLRKIISRFPNWAIPKPVHYSLVLQFTEDGKILRTWQDPEGTFTTTTGAITPGDGYLYVSSVDSDSIGRIPFP
ncbi:MAG: SMP-30/gluconolactonase/LRE family protein [Maricaulaceae bacterium]